MRIFVTTYTHFGHESLATKFGARPHDFEERVIKRWQEMIQPEDLVIHLGDVFVGKAESWKEVAHMLPGR